MAVIAKRTDGWGWTVLHGGANTARWEGGQCESLEEAKEAAGKVLKRKITDEEYEGVRLQMIERRNAKAIAIFNRK